MLSVVLQIHRNILSSQCYIRYVADSNSVNTIKVECFSSKLQVQLLMNGDVIKKLKISTPNEFFIPSTLSCDANSSVESDSTVLCRATSTPAGQFIAECTFRLQISEADQLDQIESELKVDVIDYFKERFKNCANWSLFCSSCGVGLPLKPLFVESVREYSESELSEGWFCHGNGPQPELQPSSQILYIDDTSFYLYPTPDWNVNHLKSMVQDKSSCHDQEINCQKCDYTSNVNTDCSDISYSISSDILSSNKSTSDCSYSENSDQSIRKELDISSSDCTHSQQHKHLTAVNFTDVENKNDLHVQTLGNSVPPHLKRAESSISKHPVDRKESIKVSKALNPAIECPSCGDVLAAEKSSAPFVRFYLDKLMFKNSSFGEDHLEYAHKITLLSFWSLVTKSRTSLLPSKLFLQSKVRCKELCLLLWIPSSPVAQFLLQGSLEDISQEVNLKTEPVYKVLYFVGTFRSENVRSWRHDFSVDFYSVSDKMMKTLAKILDASRSHLPETSNAEGFSCGFLAAPS